MQRPPEASWRSRFFFSIPFNHQLKGQEEWNLNNKEDPTLRSVSVSARTGKLKKIREVAICFSPAEICMGVTWG